jgi:hypothetical protein
VARRAQADGTVDPDTDPEYIGQALFGMIPGFVLQRLILRDVTPDTYTAGVAALLRAPERKPVQAFREHPPVALRP